MKTFDLPVLDNTAAAAALDEACDQVRINLPLYTDRCQNHSSVNNLYPACDNNQWTCGFWPGEVWLAYERTGEESFKQSALTLVDSFAYRIDHKIEVDHHDMGFLYSPSCVAAYKLVGSEKARDAAIKAADQLISRFQEKGQFIQAWGEMGAPENYRYIIDCLLNLPLLYWATETTGDNKYADIAHRHITTCLANSFRPDGSTYHTFFMNPDGTPSHGATCQGYKDDSFWARGQAWGVYGSVLSYRYTKNPEYLDTFRKALNFYLTRLPDDLVPYWDMIFTTGTEEPRDSSSAAIVACGLLEAAKYLPADEAAACDKLARQMMGSLVKNYAVHDHKPGAGQILHGTYSKKSPYNTCTPEGVDECTSWGDYFYMEALTRLTKDWQLYW
ncbi:glycoside hydrolase family 88 protein [Gemmiger formicilis]|uniref:glycoside hydrolase family 88 protein n=1 Tax=Gemmiger formicilis TaxID=745368 RepID=UPI001956D166|nr:glycoside hydrolase family 88 protein [Gemmiger formicilis]MBM6717453.1 glycoside hydrolase family 88 protein [Gemmiger formicilis]